MKDYASEVLARKNGSAPKVRFVSDQPSQKVVSGGKTRRYDGVGKEADTTRQNLFSAEKAESSSITASVDRVLQPSPPKQPPPEKLTPKLWQIPSTIPPTPLPYSNSGQEESADSLLDGSYNEADNAQDFQRALQEWRNSKPQDTISQAAKAAENNFQNTSGYGADAGTETARRPQTEDTAKTLSRMFDAGKATQKRDKGLSYLEKVWLRCLNKIALLCLIRLAHDTEPTTNIYRECH